MPMAVFRASSPGRPTSQLSRYRRSHNVARTASEKSLNTRFPQISPCLNASPAGNEATLSARRRGDVPDEIERISIQVDVGVPLKASKRGRPAGIKPSGRDLEILWQVHIWMTWARYRTRSFDQLVRWACMIRPMPGGRSHDIAQSAETASRRCRRSSAEIRVSALGLAAVGQGPARKNAEAKRRVSLKAASDRLNRRLRPNDDHARRGVARLSGVHLLAQILDRLVVDRDGRAQDCRWRL